MSIPKPLKYFIYDLIHLDTELIKVYLRLLRNKFRMLRKPNFPSEIFSWERHVHYETKSSAIFFKRSDSTKKSILLSISMLEKKYHHIKCLDIGPGPTSQFYTTFFLNKPQYEIISVDPLAKFYKDLHKKYNSDYDIVCIPGFGENLNKIFPEKSFDIVYSQNAIDHSQSPVKFIRNMYYVLKSNGYMILYGILNEGSIQNWLGLHKWDILVDNGKLLLSNKKHTYNRYNLLKDLNLKLVFKEILKEYIGGKIERRYTLIYKKL